MSTDRKQDLILFTALGLAIFAVFALTLLLGPDPVPPTPAPGPDLCKPVPFQPGSNYLPPTPNDNATTGVWYAPTGERYGFSIHEDSPIYPTQTAAQRC